MSGSGESINADPLFVLLTKLTWNCCPIPLEVVMMMRIILMFLIMMIMMVEWFGMMMSGKIRRSWVEKRRERLEAGTCGLGCSDALWKRTDAPLGCSSVEPLLGSQAPRLSGSSVCSSGGGRWQARCWRHHPTSGPSAEQPVATELLSSQLLLALPSSQLLLFSTSIFVLQVLKVL